MASLRRSIKPGFEELENRWMPAYRPGRVGRGGGRYRNYGGGIIAAQSIRPLCLHRPANHLHQ